MSWSRSTSIVATLAEVTQLTMAQNLANLEDGSTDALDLLGTASSEVYDWLVVDGIDPTKLADETVNAFKRAVAFRFLHFLGLMGHMGDYDDRRFETEAANQYKRVRPKSTTEEQPARPGEVLPIVVNHSAPYFHSPSAVDNVRTIS